MKIQIYNGTSFVNRNEFNFTLGSYVYNFLRLYVAQITAGLSIMPKVQEIYCTNIHGKKPEDGIDIVITPSYYMPFFWIEINRFLDVRCALGTRNDSGAENLHIHIDRNPKTAFMKFIETPDPRKQTGFAWYPPYDTFLPVVRELYSTGESFIIDSHVKRNFQLQVPRNKKKFLEVVPSAIVVNEIKNTLDLILDDIVKVVKNTWYVVVVLAGLSAINFINRK